MTANAEKIAAELTVGPRAALINFPGGRPDWLAITTAAGKDRKGSTRSWRTTVGPLVNMGLIVGKYPPRRPDGTRGHETFSLTPLGLQVQSILSAKEGANRG